MGKGTKLARDWAETTLQVIIDAEDFYIHTVKILRNEKHFKPTDDLDKETLYTIQREALHLVVAVRTANKINVSKDPDRARDRLALQEEAMTSCDLLETYLNLSKRQFHLDSDKFWYWYGLLDKVTKRLVAWHKSDKTRFRDASRFASIAESLSQQNQTACGRNGNAPLNKEV